MLKQHSQLVVVLMGALDLAVTAAAWLVCYFVRFHSGWFDFVGPAPGLEAIEDVIVITLLLVLLVFVRCGLYRPRRLQSRERELIDIARACLIVWVVEVVIAHFLHSAPVSRKLQGMFLVAWPTMLIAYRGAVRLALRLARKRGRNMRTCAIIGAGRLGQHLVHSLREQPWSGYDIHYFVEDQRIGERLLDLPVYGPLSDLTTLLHDRPVDSVFVALGQERHDQLEAVLAALTDKLIDVNVVPDLLSYHFLCHEISQVGGLPVVNLTHSPQSGWNALLKRAFDLVVGTAATIIFAPVMLVIALAIKLTSSGGVFYSQKRASLGGREFVILKFRSMAVGAEKVAGPGWSAGLDHPSITPVGRFLRRFSLDELPQLFNVLAGRMSLVGPRPEQPEFIEEFSRTIPRYMLRHHVKAGMTGWAQVNGYRGATNLRKRLQYDLDYINRWSLGFDVWILLLTVIRGFVHPEPPKAEMGE